MALTSKQRAYLRRLAMNEDTIIQIGKGGVTDSVVESVSAALKARELVKGKVLESALLSAREVSDALCEALGAEGIQVVGNKFVLYRYSEKKEKQEKEQRKAKKMEEKNKKNF